MKFKRLVVALAASTALLAACQPAPSAAKKDAAAASQTIATNGTITTPAMITAVHDAGYPMFSVTATVAGQAAPLELLLNAEDADLGGQAAESFNGKSVMLAYKSEPETGLTDIRQGDRSLFGVDAPKQDPSWTFVTGVLSGAEEITSSDLPGEIVVTSADGAKVSFEYFVGPELKAANGKTVTAYYVTDVVNRVTAIKPVTR
jgi:hypothetical protein